MSRVKLCLRVGLVSCLLLLTVFLSSASAACGGQVNRSGNTGYALCGSGAGIVRVKVQCQSGSWPYVGYVYGPWVLSVNAWPQSSATCPGGSWLNLVYIEYA